jgi:hypothetical protein
VTEQTLAPGPFAGLASRETVTPFLFLGVPLSGGSGGALPSRHRLCAAPMLKSMGVKKATVSRGFRR